MITQDDLMIVDELHGSIQRLAGVIEDAKILSLNILKTSQSWKRQA